MTDATEKKVDEVEVVVPYARFLERRERRRRIAAELVGQDPPPAIEAEVLAVAAVMPVPNRPPGRHEDPYPAKSFERTT